MLKFWSSGWSMLRLLIVFLVGFGVYGFMESYTLPLDQQILISKASQAYDQGVKDAKATRLGLAERLVMCLKDTSYYNLSYSGGWEIAKLDSLKRKYMTEILGDTL